MVDPIAVAGAETRKRLLPRKREARNGAGSGTPDAMYCSPPDGRNDASAQQQVDESVPVRVPFELLEQKGVGCRAFGRRRISSTRNELLRTRKTISICVCYSESGFPRIGVPSAVFVAAHLRKVKLCNVVWAFPMRRHRFSQRGDCALPVHSRFRYARRGKKLSDEPSGWARRVRMYATSVGHLSRTSQRSRNSRETALFGKSFLHALLVRACCVPRGSYSRRRVAAHPLGS